MKHRLLTLLAIVFTLPLYAQQGDVVLCEGFFNPWLEEGWDAKGDDWVVWYISNTTFAGCKPNEMQMYPDINFEGTTRLVTPIVELGKYDFINFQFNHALEATQGEISASASRKTAKIGKASGKTLWWVASCRASICSPSTWRNGPAKSPNFASISLDAEHASQAGISTISSSMPRRKTNTATSTTPTETVLWLRGRPSPP